VLGDRRSPQSFGASPCQSCDLTQLLWELQKTPGKKLKQVLAEQKAQQAIIRRKHGIGGGASSHRGRNSYATIEVALVRLKAWEWIQWTIETSMYPKTMYHTKRMQLGIQQSKARRKVKLLNSGFNTTPIQRGKSRQFA